MVAIRSLPFLALAAYVSAQSIDTLDPCGRECYQNAVAQWGHFGCTSADDTACLCSNVDFHNAIDSCASGVCPPGYGPNVVAAANNFCAAFTAAPSPAPTTTEATEAVEPTPEPTPTEAAELTSTSEQATSNASSTTFVTSTSVNVAVATQKATETTSNAVPTATADGSETPDDDDNKSSSTAGLTRAAKVGIGVGACAAFLAFLGLAGFFYFRSRRAPEEPATNLRYKISGPMPNAEHQQTYNIRNSEYDIGNELEANSRRYEDMLPREKPREMV